MGGRRPPRSPAVVVFWAILALWMLYPLTVIGKTGQDGLHDPVAGDLWRSHPESIYTDSPIEQPDDTFTSRFCDFTGHTDHCAAYATIYTSSPTLLPVYALLALLGGSGATLLLRLVSAAALVGGLLILFHRMGPRVPPIVAPIVALGLTPLAFKTMGLAQNSPILFFSACLGLSQTSRTRRAAAVGAVWFVASMTKLFPVELAIVLVIRRRWKVLATAAVLGVASLAAFLVVGPASLFSRYVSFTSYNTRFLLTSPYNGSPRVLVSAVLPGTKTSGVVTALVSALFIGVAVAVFLRFRRSSLDAQWAVAYFLAMLISPLVWIHYCWLVVPALAAVLADIPRARPIHYALLAVSAVFLGGLATVDYEQVPAGVVQGCFLIVVVGALVWMAPLTTGVSSSPDREPSLRP